MHIVKSVGVLSIAKIMALVQACLGLIFAPFFLLIGVLGSWPASTEVHLPACLAYFLPYSCRYSTG